MGEVHVIHATIVFESTDGKDEALFRHVTNVVSGCLRFTRDANSDVRTYDKNGKFLAGRTDGQCSKEMESVIDELLDNCDQLGA